MYSIKTLCLATAVLALSGCGNNSSDIAPPIITAKKDIVNAHEPIWGERINGPANIRDTVDGEVIFSLYDKTLVSCTEENNGWHVISIIMDLAKDEFGIDTIRQGRKIVVNGKEVGVVLKDVAVSTMGTSTKTLGELLGYTRKNNIYSYSIIENALVNFLSKDTSRTITSMQSFIKDFKLEGDTSNKPFATFMNYETGIEDPSPLQRIELIFHNNNFIGAVHSRPISVPNTTDYKLERGFHVVFFNNVDKELRERFINYFNSYINTVD
ncbi:hypothetical protein QEG73_05735 [Chitinophagaceae bacterium 26-R-25]|nr:hypothetical protein [Chitinophagaceae bacterium 26-R-25]